MAKIYLPRSVWLMLFLLIAMILYGTVPAVENGVNGAIGAFFGPLIDMFSLAFSMGG